MDPSNKRITIHDIAERAEVSLSTVSRVLNNSAGVSEKKRVAVESAMAELDYRPNHLAQGLAKGVTRTVGVLTQYISAPFFDHILQGILDGLRGSGYSPLIADGYWQPAREQKTIQMLLDRYVDGLIVLGGEVPESYLRVVANRVPLILVGRTISGLEETCIRFDNFEGAFTATQHLIQLGHRQIAHISGVMDRHDAQRRCEGYRQAHVEAGLTVNDALIVDGDYVEQSGVLAVEMLLSRGHTFSAIFAANDQMAYGARLALYRHGIRVPDEVSLVGFDDQPHSAFTAPPLTTIRQPAVMMGKEAAQALLHRIEGRSYTLSTFPSELVIRESTARYR